MLHKGTSGHSDTSETRLPRRQSSFSDYEPFEFFAIQVVAGVLRGQPRKFLFRVYPIIVSQLLDCQQKPGVRPEIMPLFGCNTRLLDPDLLIRLRTAQPQKPANR